MSERIKVLYDCQALSFQRFGGVSLYYAELLAHLPAIVKPVIGGVFVRSVYFKKYPKLFVWDWLDARLIKRNRVLSALFIRSVRLINGAIFLGLLLRKDFDLVHITWEVENWWLPFLRGKPYVCTVHDLIPELFWNNEKFVRRRKKIWQGASRLIAVSENTKRDCIRIVGIPDDRIDVIYHASTGYNRGRGGQFGALGDFILFVGRRDGYKNFAWFVKAAAPFLRRHPNVRLVCTGEPFANEEQRMLDDLGVALQVVCRYVHVEEMSALYESAKVFVYPSLYEGFGMPVLDAFSFGCPALLSNNVCFQEIAGDAALYFKIGDQKDLQEKLENIMLDEEVRNQMIIKGRKRAECFSWDHTAEGTLRVYKKCLSH